MFSNPANHFHKLLRLLRIHAGSGFVEEQEFRLGGKGASNFQSTLCTVGKILGDFVSVSVEFENFQQIECFVLDRLLLAEIASHAQDRFNQPVLDVAVISDFYVVENAELTEEANVLECAGNAALSYLVRLKPDERLAVKSNFARRRFVDARYQIESRRLARAVRSDKPD